MTRAIVVGGAPVRPGALVEAAFAGAALIVAADSGAATVTRMGRRPDVVIGDMDSIDPQLLERLRAEGVEIAAHPAPGLRTDMHVAILAALERGATSVTILGAIGGERLDHSIANLLLLGSDDFAAARLRLVDGADEAHVVRDQVTLAGEPHELVSLLPLTHDASGVTTEGLRYPLVDATLPRASTLGVSNEMTAAAARVSLRGGVLLVAHHHGRG